jgi:hypothetical protein
MTTRDYKKLAQIFGEGLARVYAREGLADFDTAYGVWRSLYTDTCEMLAQDNPRFDEMKFQYAVATIAAETPVTLAP